MRPWSALKFYSIVRSFRTRSEASPSKEAKTIVKFCEFNGQIDMFCYHIILMAIPM